jgi:hypothetical protein
MSAGMAARVIDLAFACCNVIPKLYSKAQANAELRKMLNIGRTEDRPENDVSRLSDAELIQQLADTAKELGIAINLNYEQAGRGATRLIAQLPALVTGEA